MRFRLRSDHYIDDQILGEGVEITPAKFAADGKVLAKGRIYLTPGLQHGIQIPGAELETLWRGPPSACMEGVDEEARKACETRNKTFMTVDNLPLRVES